MAEFSAEMTFDQDPETVFAFHQRPQNILQLVPTGTHAELVEAPELLVLHSELEMKVSVMGMSQRIRLRVAEFDAHTLIVDEQLKGPFKAWKQIQEFAPHPRGGTRLTYRVQFEPPGGMLGFIVTQARVLENLEKVIPFRQYRTRELLDAQASGTKS